MAGQFEQMAFSVNRAESYPSADVYLPTRRRPSPGKRGRLVVKKKTKTGINKINDQCPVFLTDRHFTVSVYPLPLPRGEVPGDGSKCPARPGEGLRHHCRPTAGRPALALGSRAWSPLFKGSSVQNRRGVLGGECRGGDGLVWRM